MCTQQEQPCYLVYVCFFKEHKSPTHKHDFLEHHGRKQQVSYSCYR